MQFSFSAKEAMANKFSSASILIFLIGAAVINADDDIYDGCGTTKQCLGYPGDCIPDKDCVTFSSTFVRGLCKSSI